MPTAKTCPLDCGTKPENMDIHLRLVHGVSSAHVRSQLQSSSKGKRAKQDS